jgi:phage/plasmid-like protein (TIGR03299 family)
MAHNINRMVYAGEVPWHGLGVQLPANGTVQQIADAAGFYTAQLRPVFVGGVTGGAMLNVKAVVRADSNTPLSIVTDGYGLVQFRDVAETVAQAVGGGAVIHTAGTLGENGARMWVLGELPNPIRVRGDESETRKYFLGTTSHDGSSAIKLKNVATRVVCQNTLGAALGERSGAAEWSIRHTVNAQARLDDAGKAFAALVKGMERFGELANLMAATKFSDAQLKTTLDRVIPIPDDDASHTRLETNRATIAQLAVSGTGIGAAIRGTAWAAFQGFTEWADHHRTVRQLSDGAQRAAQLNSVWFGGAAQVKQDALTAILEEAGIELKAA